MAILENFGTNKYRRFVLQNENLRQKINKRDHTIKRTEGELRPQAPPTPGAMASDAPEREERWG
jgi:hypothetical protein